MYLEENLKLTPQSMSDRAAALDELEDMHQQVWSTCIHLFGLKWTLVCRPDLQPREGLLGPACKTWVGQGIFPWSLISPA